MAFGPKADTLLTGGTDGATRLWTVPEMKPIHVMKGHDRTLYASAFHPSGTLAASADRTGRLRIWDTEKGQALRTIETGSRLNGLAFSPDGALLYGGGAGGVVVWDTKTGEVRATPEGAEGHVSDLALHRDGELLAVASGSILRSDSTSRSSIARSRISGSSLRFSSRIGARRAAVAGLLGTSAQYSCTTADKGCRLGPIRPTIKSLSLRSRP